MSQKKSTSLPTSGAETLEIFVYDYVSINEPAPGSAARVPLPVFVPDKEPGFARIMTPLTAILVAARPPTPMKMILMNPSPVLL